MKKLNCKEIKYEEKSILYETIKFLDKNKIEYYIWAGSFLGCIRHKGFIPWDDDIDLALTRANYNKLLNILKKDKTISNNLSAIGFELNNSVFPFLKVINKNIILNEEEGIDENLWIDIFPLDGSSKKIIYRFNCRVFFCLYFVKRFSINNQKIQSSNKIKYFLKKIISLFLKPIKLETITKIHIKLSSKYSIDETGYATNNIWGVGFKERFPKDLLNEILMYDFEDIKVRGLKDFDTWLSIRYGDYMTLPSIEKRETHKFIAWKVEENEK